jgi:hypothetical protein
MVSGVALPVRERQDGPRVGFDGVYQSVMAWAKGEKVLCPKLP